VRAEEISIEKFVALANALDAAVATSQDGAAEGRPG
jgi:hypothetical protein